MAHGSGHGAGRRGAARGHINLLPARRGMPRPLKVLAWLAVLGALAAAVVKFGVIDYRAGIGVREAERDRLAARLADAEAGLADFDELRERLRAYEAAGGTAEGGSELALEALRIVEEVVAPVARVDSASVEDGRLTLRLRGVTLERLGELVELLEEEPAVASVVPRSATDGGGDGGVSVELLVALEAGADEDEGPA